MAGRRSKYDKIDLKQVEMLAKKGWIDTEIAKFFGIAERTFHNWKKKHPEFLQSIKKGKEVADNEVVKALFERATGYSHPDVHISNYQGNITVTEIVKHYPPDPVSCIFWLKNRRKHEWRDKVEDSQYDAPDIPADIDNLSASEVNKLYDEIRNKKD